MNTHTVNRPSSSLVAFRPISALLLLIGLLVVTTSSTTGAGSAAESEPTTARWRSKVDSWVLDSAARYDSAEFLIFLDRQADLSAASHLASKKAKGRFVFERLSRVAEETQPAVLRQLLRDGIEHRPFWIANMIWARGDLHAIEAVASRTDVAHLFASPPVELDQPASDRGFRSAALQSSEPSIDHVRVPTEFWANDFAGQGVVIAGQDTGYDWQHPALQSSYRGWTGASADHNYNWHDAIHSGGGDCGPDSLEPCDDSRHGTHTMGTMVGDDGGGNRVGLAPAARWIGCRNMDQGVGTPATYSECFQWFLAPTDLEGRNPDPDLAPDVINNSWTCPASEGCTSPDALRAVVENTRAAGILVVASAGNAGPDCSTISSPISLYDATLTVGATTVEDQIASFSSRGAITADGSGRRKPDIAAPGIDIRSSVPGGSYDWFNGTSMAAPHVAGMAALVLSAAECKRGRPKRIERHLFDSALPRPAEATCGEPSVASVPNNTYGHGVLRAVLPSCPGDGRIAGATSGIGVSKVVCRNKTSGQKSLLPLDGMGAWNCMAHGLVTSSSDRVLIKVTGRANELESVSVQVDGLDTVRAICRNRTTGRQVRIPLSGSRSFSCERSGLEVRPEDRLKITVIGRASADS